MQTHNIVLPDGSSERALMETTVNGECIKCCKVCSTCMYGPKNHHQVFSFSNGNPAGRQQHGMLKAA